MNNKPSSMKSWIIIAIVLIVAIVAYFIYSGSSTNSSSGTIQANSDATGQLGQQVLSLLNQVNSLQINTALFTSQAYTSLKDFSVTIPTQNIGRANPFAPIPGVSQYASTTRINVGR
jgi:flagellar basal body-associated protein FliL